jgi:hypothetical protein
MTGPDHRAHAARRRRPGGRTSARPFGTRASRRGLRFALLVATAGVFTTLLAVDLWNLRHEILPRRAVHGSEPPRADGAVTLASGDATPTVDTATDAPHTDAPHTDAPHTDAPATDGSSAAGSSAVEPDVASQNAAGPAAADAAARTKALPATHPASAAPSAPAAAAKTASAPNSVRDRRSDTAAIGLRGARRAPDTLAPERFVIPQPGSALEFVPSDELSRRLVQAARRGERIVIRGRVGPQAPPSDEQDAAVRAERARRFLIVRGVPAERIWIGAGVRDGDGDRALIVDVSMRGEASDDAVLATAPTRAPAGTNDGPRP